MEEIRLYQYVLIEKEGKEVIGAGKLFDHSNGTYVNAHGVFKKVRVRKTCRIAFGETAAKMGTDILALEFGPDHAHLFVGNCKNYSVPQMAQRFKGYSSYVIRKEEWDSIKDKLGGDHFWSSGYFHEAVGRITSEATQFYIERQQKKHLMNIDYGPYEVTVSTGQTSLTDFSGQLRGYTSGFSPG